MVDVFCASFVNAPFIWQRIIVGIGVFQERNHFRSYGDDNVTLLAAKIPHLYILRFSTRTRRSILPAPTTQFQGKRRSIFFYRHGWSRYPPHRVLGYRGQGSGATVVKSRSSFFVRKKVRSPQLEAVFLSVLEVFASPPSSEVHHFGVVLLEM